MQIQNAAVTGSFTYNGVDISSITGSTSNITSLNAITASILSTTASLNTASGSAITRLSALEVTSGSNITRISALESASGSAITRLSSIESTTGSLNTASGSAITRLSALEVTSGSNITRLSSLESKTGSYATTGSNTFVDGQYLSSSYNPTGFSTTASLYTDGGLRVTRDAYISGTLYLNNVTVYGTQSVCYITSSQLNIASNLISVNTATPSVRFGGLAVYDSGSTGLTGSILWDSQNNHWVYSNPSGSSYSGGMFISGPRTSTLGSETGTTSCMLMAGQGGDHITSSMIYHDSATTCIPNTLIGSTVNVGTITSVCGVISGTPANSSSLLLENFNGDQTATTLKLKSGRSDVFYHMQAFSGNTSEVFRIEASGRVVSAAGACFASTVCVGTNLVVRSAATFCDTVGLFGGSSQLYIGGTSNASDFAILQWCATDKSLNIHNQSTGNSPQLIIACNGNVSIGTVESNYKLRVEGTLYSLNAARFNGVVFSDCRLMIGVAGNDQTYASIFVGGALTTGTSQYALLLDPQLSGTTNYGVFANARIKASTAATNAYGVYILNNEILSGASIVNNYGLYIANQTNGSSVNYALYSAGGTNYFGGCVGIGTSSPQGPLDVYRSNSGGLGGHIILRNNGAAVGNEMAVMFVDGDLGTTRAAISSTTENSPYFGDIKFKTGLGTYACLATRMTITGAGNVGIGFSTVSSKLQVAGEITSYAGTNTSYYSYMNYLGTTYNFGAGESSDNVDFKICGGSTWSSGGNLRFWTQPGNTTPLERMRITSGGRVGILNTSPQGKLEVGIACSNSTAGGHFFSTFQIPVNTWSVVFYVPSNNQWNAVTEFTWTSAGDFNRSGAAYMRWAYEPGSASLGVVYTLYNNSQNATASFRRSGNEIQVYITGGAADYYVQVRIQGSQAS